MDKLKLFLSKQDQFAKLVEFEVFHKKNPRILVLVNDKAQYYLYYETNRYRFTTTHLIETNANELELFRNSKNDFNDIFNGKRFRLNIFKSHIEVKTTDSHINELYYDSKDYYVSTYNNLQEHNVNRKNFKKTTILSYITLLLLLCATLSQLITMKWLANTLTIILMVIAFILMYYSFYKIILRDKKDRKKRDVYDGE